MKRKWKAIVRNAAFWAVAWSAASVVVIAAITMFSPERKGQFIAGVLFLSPRFAIWGAISGTVFSSIVGLLLEGRKLSQLSVPLFGLAGAAGTAIFVPLALQTSHFLSGQGFLAWDLVSDDAVITGVFGGISAAASLALAKFASRVTPTELEASDDATTLSAGSADLTMSSPSRASEAQERR